MTSSARLFAALAFSGALAAAGGAGAQAQTPPQGGQSARPDLSALLHLRPDQMGAYQALQRAAQPSQADIATLRSASPQAMAGLTTPQRLDRAAAVISVRDALFHRESDALRAFYNQLSPDQRKIYDQLSAAPQGQGPGRPGQ